MTRTPPLGSQPQTLEVPQPSQGTMQKSQIGFQATLQVRNRMVQAYSDIMNMNV